MKKASCAAIYQVARNNFRTWRTDRRYLAVLIAMLLFMFKASYGLTLFSRWQGIRISPFAVVAPLLFHHHFFLFGLVMIFSNAPFITSLSSQEIIRVGRRQWLLGQILYIIMTAFFYTLFLHLLPLIFYAPRLFITSKWGDLLKLLASDRSELPRYFVIEFSRKLLAITPWRILLLSLVLFFVQSVLIGTLMLTVGLIQRKDAAVPVVVATIYILIPQVGGFLDNRIAKWIPSFMSIIGNQKYSRSSLASIFRTPLESILILLAISLGLALVSFIVIRKKEFVVRAKQA